MREIKFRAKKSTRGGEWLYFSPWEITDWCILILDSMTQYTGLKDKNGKEIYEGDIIKYNDGFGIQIKDEVCFKYASWGVLNYSISLYSIVFPHSEGIEVIGNIFENPELLENEND